jgi:hypothetical protein
MKVPEGLKQIRIDVGLAGEAPNAALWLSQTTDRFVIGVEPLPYHWRMIKNFETSGTVRPYPENIPLLQLEEGVVKLNREIVCEIGNKFLPIEAAIDNVKDVTTQKFYMMDRTDGASGSSSLLTPSEHHPHFIEKEIEVTTHSLEYILDKVDWGRFEYIEHIKTDCEGKDFDVVKSIGKYLSKIVFITSEMTGNLHHWHGSTDPQSFVQFMQDSGFKIIFQGHGEIIFLNKALEQKVTKDKLEATTLGL